MTPRNADSLISQYPNHLPLIYLIESDTAQAGLLKQTLLENGFRVDVFTEADTEFHAAYTSGDITLPSAVVMNIVFSADDMPTSSINDLDLCKKLKIPVVVTSEREDLPARLAALRAGARHYLSRPVDPSKLINLLDEITDRQKIEPYRVLLIDDDKISIDQYNHILSKAGMVVQTLLEPLKTLDTVKSFKPDLILLDIYMPEINGAEIATILRDSGFQLPILFVSGETDLTQQVLSLKNGGDDFLVKPVQPDHLVATVTARAKRSRRSNAVCYRLETTLYERERERLALDHHSIVSTTDKFGNINYVNDQFCEASGYSREELLGQNHRILKSGKHDSAFYQALWGIISKGNVWHGETCNKRKDGSLFWVETTITPFLDANGEPYQYVAIRTDITQIKENEQMLRAIVDGTSTRTSKAFFSSAVQSLVETMGVRFSFIAQKDAIDDTKIRTIAIWDTDHILENFSYPIKDTPCEHVLNTGLSVYPEKVAELFPNDLWLKENAIESYIGLPILDSNGVALAHICVIDDKPMSNIDNKIDLLRIFAASVAGEIERGKSEEALRDSEARLNFLVSSSPVTIYTSEVTPPFAATYISPNVKRLMGYEPEQFTNNSDFWAERIHPEDQQQVFDNLPQLFEHGRHLHEYRFKKQDGSYCWMRDELRLVKDDTGEPVEIAGFWADISDRKLTEQALERNQERLRRGQAFANIGTWDWDITTGDLFWSERIAPLFGYAEGEIETSYENFINAIHPDDRQAVSDAITACVVEDAVYDIEHRVQWPDGTVRWLHERGAVVRNAEGKPLHMLGVVQDIHYRKVAELALLEREHQLSEAQKLASIGNWKADLLTGELVWSDEIYSIFGYEPRSFEPSVEIFHSAVHPDDRTKVNESEKRAEQTGHHDVVHRIIRPDGSVRHVHELAQSETDASGNMVQLTGTVQDVTEQVESESRLRDSEERFAFAVEGSGDGIWDWDMRSNAMQFSRLYMEMLGYAENELPQQADTWINSVHPDDIERIQQKLREYLEGKTNLYHVEIRLRCKDDSYKWILCRGQVVNRDENDSPIRMIGIHSDITEQKLASEELNRFKTTLDMTKDCVFMFEPESLKFFYVNQGAIKQFGYSETELMNMTPVSIKPHSDEVGFRKIIKPLIKGETDSLTFETLHQHKDGTEIPVEISLQYIEPVGESARFVAIVRNITDRIAMQRQMEQQKNLLDMLHSSMTDFVEKGNFHETMNSMLDTLLELTGSKYGFIGEVLYDEDGSPYLKTHAITNIAWDQKTQALYDDFSEKGFEFRNLNTLFGHVLTSQKTVLSNDPASDPRSTGLPEGHPAMHSFLGVPIFYGRDLIGMYGIANRENGYDDSVREFLRTFDTTYGVMIHSQRITNMEINNRKELIDAKEVAENANRAKSEFLSSMSHELRTPMNAILGFGQLLKFDDTISELQQDNVQEILTAGHHLLSLINEVLDLAKVESGQIELSLEAINVHQVVEECFNLIEPLAMKRDIRISHSGLKGVAVRADYTRFKQVLINLLSNAIKYNHESGSVRVDVQNIDKDRLKIIIQDTGIGIPEENLVDLFLPFNRLTAEKSNIEGTGIGLTITRRIVELMGGKIDVQSEVGVGSSFWIELPIETLAETDQTETTNNKKASSQTRSTVKHVVLYIEDNPANLKLVAQILGRRKNIHLLTAHTPEIGIELAKNRLPELILLDINMPNMDGYDVMDIFKADNKLKDIPVVAVTANAMTREIGRGKAAGFDDYVTKPIDVGHFLKIIENYLPEKDIT